MPTLHDSPRRLRTSGAALPAVLPVVLLAVLATGCGRPLSVQHGFFAPMSGVADKISAQASHAVAHHRALHAAHRECGPRPSGSIAWRAPDHAQGGPNPGTAAA